MQCELISVVMFLVCCNVGSLPFQENRAEAWLPPPQPTSSPGSQDRGMKSSQSPKELHQRSTEDKGQKSPIKNAMSQPSQQGVSNRLPFKECTVRLLLHSSGKIAAKFDYDAVSHMLTSPNRLCQCESSCAFLEVDEIPR